MKSAGLEGHKSQGFGGLGLGPEIVQALEEQGYEEPTPIQREAIPALLAGSDLLGQAATGTGKTAAFSLPILQQLRSGERSQAPTALVLVPTRELAVQVSEAIHGYGRRLGARVVPIYGGQPIGWQLRSLSRGVDIVVATPGRALDHISRGTLVLDRLRTVVLDEADEMLDMGFAEDIEAILEGTPAERQTVLFSATMPPRIEAITRKHLRDPVRIQIARERADSGAQPRVRQTAYVIPRAYKVAAIGRVLDMESPTAALIFCRTRNEVDQLTETLNARGYRAEALHGGMNQEQRDRVMGRVRTGTAQLLIATDVAARGLDIDQLTHVFNYDLPSAPEAYVHRIGRVGRAGRGGVAITLAEPREHSLLRNIERLTKQRIEIARIPTAADLQTRRLELTATAIRESAAQGGLSRFREVIESLSDDLDLAQIALAAIKLAHESRVGSEDEKENIPDLSSRIGRERPDARAGRKAGRSTEPARGRRTRPDRAGADTMTRVFIGAGRSTGIRPQDLVGAIANEAGISGREIGAIEIADRFSLVEIPESSADRVIDALRESTIKGQKTVVRRERYRSQ